MTIAHEHVYCTVIKKDNIKNNEWAPKIMAPVYFSFTFDDSLLVYSMGKITCDQNSATWFISPAAMRSGQSKEFRKKFGSKISFIKAMTLI